MIEQEVKQYIDVGEIGNASTGDILYDGGVKINHNFDSVYNAFGDQRLGSVGHGEGNQTIHATGYYQKANQYDFRTPIALGTMWDVDTTTGAASPTIVSGKPGECVVFVNSNGSFSVNSPLSVAVAAGSFAGIQGPLNITTPYSRVECWCVKKENGVSVWNYSVSSMFGDKQAAINGTFPVAGAESKIRIAHVDEYNTIKLLVTAMNPNSSKMRQSEINLLVENTAGIDHSKKKVHATEFAVFRVGNTSEEDEIVKIGFEIDTNGFVNALVSSSVSGIKLAIKSIATQRVGSA